MKKKPEKTKQNINIRNVIIRRGSRSALRKIKEPIWGTVLDAIECGNWWILFDSYEYRDIKEHLETEVFHDFFNIPRDIVIEVKGFQTDILSFTKGH